MSRYNVRALSAVRVLVVDDEPSIVDFIQATLQENDYEVVAFTDPREP